MDDDLATRRSVLRALLLAASTPWWVVDAFAASSTSDAALTGALREAARAGRPLLVLVVPEEEQEFYLRGSVLGAWLNHASDEVWQTLAAAAFVCARPSELARAVPDLRLPADAWLVRVDPAAPVRGVAFGGSPPEGALSDDAALQRAIDWLSRGAVGLLAVDDPARAQAERLGAAGGAAAREAVVRRRVPGSWWADAGGCGTTIEELPVERQVMMDCGMGHVTDRASRLLWFWDPNAEAR